MTNKPAQEELSTSKLLSLADSNLSGPPSTMSFTALATYLHPRSLYSYPCCSYVVWGLTLRLWFFR